MLKIIDKMNHFKKNGRETTLKGPEKRAQKHKIELPKKEPDNPDKDTSLAKNLPLESFKYLLPIKGFMEKTIEEKIEEDVLKVFENSTSEDYWKTLDEISKRTEYSSEEINRATENSWTFIENYKREITPRKLWRKFTPLLIKMHQHISKQIY